MCDMVGPYGDMGHDVSTLLAVTMQLGAPLHWADTPTMRPLTLRVSTKGLSSGATPHHWPQQPAGWGLVRG